MKPRERMIKALNLEEPDDYCPVWEIEFHLFNNFSRRKMIYSQDFEKLSAVEKDKVLQMNAEIMVEVALEVGLSALSNIGPYWEIAPGTPAIMWLPPEDSRRFLPILKKAAGDDIYIMQWCPAMIFMPEADHYVEFAYKLYDSPEEVDEMARKQYADGMERAQYARDCGVDGLCAACDVADNMGLYFKPDQFDRYIQPYLEKWTSQVKAMGMQTIFHSDGDISLLLDRLAATELHAIQAIDPVAGMDIVKVKQQVGDRLALCGNLDLGLLQNGPVEAIREEVKRICLECKKGGGFSLGATNAVFEEISTEHYSAMIQAGREFGAYKGV